jgi:hypothetical protein
MIEVSIVDLMPLGNVEGIDPAGRELEAWH